MAVATGMNSKAAIAIETAIFGSTPIACGANSLLPLKSVNLQPTKRYAPRPVLDGHGGQSLHDNIGITYAGTLECWGYYDNQALLLLLMMSLGFSHQSNSPQNPTGSVYTHFIECDKDLDRRAWQQHEMNTPSGNAVRHFTLCIDYQNSIFEYLSCKVNNLTISGDSTDGRVIFAFDIVAHSRDLDSAINTTSAGWTGNIAYPILFNDLTVRMRPIDEYVITVANDELQIVEDTAGTPDDVDIQIPAEIYSGPALAEEIRKLANAGSANSIIYRGKYDPRNHKFEIKNTNTAHLLQIDVSDSELHDYIGFYTDPTAALTLVSQLGGRFTNVDLDSYDEVSIAGFSITINNNLEVGHQDTNSDKYIVDPLRNLKRDISFTAFLPRKTNTNFEKRVDFDVLMCGDFRFTGSLISGGEYYQFNILLPQFKISNAPSSITGEGIIPENINCIASLPLRDKIPGWDEGGAVSNSEIEKYLITEVTSVNTADAGSGVNDLTVYNGKLYAGCDKISDAILMEMDSEGTWNQTFKDFTGYQKITSMVVFENKLYIACLNDANTETHLFSYDGTTYTDEETFASASVIDMIVFKGLLLVSLSIGDIYSSSDGSTFTRRYQSGDTILDTFHSFQTFTIIEGTCYAVGNDTTPTPDDGAILKSTNGTAWTLFFTDTTDVLRCGIVEYDNWLIVGRATNSTILKIDPDGVETIVGSISANDPTTGLLFKFKQWIYFSSAPLDTFYRFDGHNPGSVILLNDMSTDYTTSYISAFAIYQDRLYFGTQDNGLNYMKVFVLRPLQEIQFEMQNTISSNPL